MAKKIVNMTEEELLAAKNAENLGELEITCPNGTQVRRPGVVGIATTAGGNYLVYCVNKAAKLFNTSVHKTREQANGRALERLRQMATLNTLCKELEVSTPETPAAEAALETTAPDLGNMSFDALMASVS